MALTRVNINANKYEIQKKKTVKSYQAAAHNDDIFKMRARKSIANDDEKKLELVFMSNESE